MFSAFGAQVTVIARSDGCCAHLDHETAERFTEVVREQVGPAHGTHPVACSPATATRCRSTLDDGTSVQADVLLVATGRVPNSDRLGAASTPASRCTTTAAIVVDALPAHDRRGRLGAGRRRNALPAQARREPRGARGRAQPAPTPSDLHRERPPLRAVRGVHPPAAGDGRAAPRRRRRRGGAALRHRARTTAAPPTAGRWRTPTSFCKLLADPRHRAAARRPPDGRAGRDADPAADPGHELRPGRAGDGPGPVLDPPGPDRGRRERPARRSTCRPGRAIRTAVPPRVDVRAPSAPTLVAMGTYRSPRSVRTPSCSTCPSTPRSTTGPSDLLVQVPRGISRHVVRFVARRRRGVRDQGGDRPLRLREHQLLRELAERSVPGRRARSAPSSSAPTTTARTLGGLLITRHLHVLAALPLAVHRPGAARPAQPAARRAGRAVRPAAPGRLLLGRLLAVEHPVPPRRRRARRLPGRRRDRRAARPAVRGQRAHDLRDRDREHRRRDVRPAGGRATSTRRSTPSSLPMDAHAALRAAVGRADQRRGHRRRARTTASTSACAGSTSLGLRRRRDGDQDRADEGRGCGSARTSSSPGHHQRRAVRAHRPARAGEPGPARCWPTSRRFRGQVGGGRRPPGPRGPRRPALAGREVLRDARAASRPTCARSCPTPSCSTRSASTAGSCPRRTARTSGARRRWPPTSSSVLQLPARHPVDLSPGPPTEEFAGHLRVTRAGRVYVG